MSRLFVCVFLVFALMIPSMVSFAEDTAKITGRWEYDLGSQVKSLAVGDVDGDGVSELVAASGKSIYVFAGNGSIKKNYNVTFSPSIVYLADVNNDSVDDILVGSSYFKVFNLSVQVFNFSNKDNIIEIPSVLYRSTRTLGDVYVISGGKTPTLFVSAGGWVRDMFVGDLNNDSEPELVVSAGGVNVDYWHRSVLVNSPPTYEDYSIDSETDECDSVTPRYVNRTVANCTFHPGSYELQRSGYMKIYEAIPPRLSMAYVYNDTEEESNNGSIIVYSMKGEILANISFNSVPMYVYSASFSVNSPKMIAYGSPITFLDQSGKNASSFKSPEQNYSVQKIFMYPVGGEKLNDVVAGFLGSTISGIFVLDRDNNLVWTYRVSSGYFTGLFLTDIDSDNVTEMVFATDKNIYALNSRGDLKWSYGLPKKIEKLAIGDIGGNGYMDFAVSLGNNLYVYEVDEKYIKAGLAGKYYEEAKDYSDLGKYDAALTSAEKSKSLYLAVSDSKGVESADLLLSEIKQNLGGIKRETAASLYKKGRSEYYLGRFNESKEYLNKALELYSAIGDEDGVEKSAEALAEVDNELNPPTTTTTTTTTSTTSTTTPQQMQINLAQYFPILAGIVVLLLVVVLVKVGLGRKGAEPKKKEEKDVIRKS